MSETNVSKSSSNQKNSRLSRNLLASIEEMLQPHLHRISDSKLKVLTIINNYHCTEAVNNTPAQRLFRIPHANLFEHLPYSKISKHKTDGI